MLQQKEERDNLTRIGLAVSDEATDAVRRVAESNMTKPLEDILNHNQHIVLHHYSNECHFRCSKRSKKKYLLTRAQMEIWYNISQYHAENNLSFCCSTAKSGIETNDLDLLHLNAFLHIFPEMFLWKSCLTNQNKSFQELLMDKKHIVYHLYNDKPCCQCIYSLPKGTYDFKLSKKQFEKLYRNQSRVPCTNTGFRGNCICMYSAKDVRKESLDDWLTSVILRSCCSFKRSLDALMDIRSRVLSHACRNQISKDYFKAEWKTIENVVADLLTHGVFDKRMREKALQEFTERLSYLKSKPLTESTNIQVLCNLRQQIESNQDTKDLSVPGRGKRIKSTMARLSRIFKSGTPHNDRKPKSDQIDELLYARSDQDTLSYMECDAVPYMEEDDQRSHEEYVYDTLILHSPRDDRYVDEMKKIIMKRVDLPDIKIASTEENIPAGANLFAAFNDLMDVSRSLLLFITPNFYDDCLIIYRMHTQLVRHYEDGDCVIPVLFGEDRIRREVRELGHLKPAIFCQEKYVDECDAFIKTMTTTLQQCRDCRI